METKLVQFHQELLQLINSHPSYSKQSLCFFPGYKGKNYETAKIKLMFVGRALNGWNRTTVQPTWNVVEALAKVTIEHDNDDLQWVIDQSGVTFNNDGRLNYNTRKSAFWRVISKTSEELLKVEHAVQSVYWSNLYRASPDGGGNPSERFSQFQVPLCKKILESEIAIFKPDYVIFLTGYLPAHPFLPQVDSNPGSGPIYCTQVHQGIKYIVLDHPQGRKESSIIEAVLECINVN